MKCGLPLWGCLGAPRESAKTTGKATTKRRRIGRCIPCIQDKPGTDPPHRIIPHFHEETEAYLRGDTAVLNRLPAAQAKALKRASRSAPRARLRAAEAQGNAGAARVRAATSARPRARWQEVRRRAPRASAAAGEQTAEERASGPAPCAVEPVDLKLQSIEPRNLDTATSVTPGRLPAYDGLRSSPPFAAAGAGAHSWKLYTGPFFDTQTPRERKESSSENIESEN
ncbi:hypothetical protein VTH06DRAFT_4321 [Thermothelomyces fergusii]